MVTGKETSAVDAVEQAVELLEMLADSEQDLSVSALSRKAGISRYKMVRLLASLEKSGVVGLVLESGKYDLGCTTVLEQKLCKNAGHLRHARPVVESLVRRQNEALYQSIIQDARPVLESLARQYNETMYITILKGEEVLFLDMVDSLRKVRAEPLVGRRFPFFSNAAGKVMRAIDSWDLLEKICKKWRGGRGGYPDPAGFRAELELIRKKGVAVDCGGMGDGISTVAVAVRDYAGKVVGALTMLGPSFRLIGARLEEEIIPSLQHGGELLSSKFGYARP